MVCIMNNSLYASLKSYWLFFKPYFTFLLYVELLIYPCSWTLYRYGLPFVSPNNILVSVVNGTGAVIESIYVLIFLIYAPKKEKMKILGLLSFILTVFCTVALVSLFALHDKKRKVLCGFAASIFSVIMYGSPLSVMVRNSYYLPKYICICCSLNQ